MAKYKTFKDLLFKPHELYQRVNSPFLTHAVMTFENGNDISVITGRYAYSDENHPYEVLCSISEEPIGHCDADDVTKIMIKLQRKTAK